MRHLRAALHRVRALLAGRDAADRADAELRAQSAAARLKVTIDKRRGRTTPQWIRELAERTPRAS